MRREFFRLIHELMEKDEKIVFITADLGYKGIDPIAKDFPDRFYNVGASEIGMLAFAVGMSKREFKPFCYSITPFLLWRGAEVIRNYINSEQAHVCLIGSGRDHDYEHDGFSHDASDDAQLMDGFTKIKSRWPVDEEEMTKYTREYLASKRPYYINLTR